MGKRDWKNEKYPSIFRHNSRFLHGSTSKNYLYVVFDRGHFKTTPQTRYHYLRYTLSSGSLAAGYKPHGAKRRVYVSINHVIQGDIVNILMGTKPMELIRLSYDSKGD